MSDRLFDIAEVPLAEAGPRKRVERPEDDVAVDRLLTVFERADSLELEAGLNWYPEAHNMCAAFAIKYSLLSTDHAAGIVAALSPMQAWPQNIIKAERLMRTGEFRGLGYVQDDAMAIYEGAHPSQVLYLPDRNNQKVRSFYENLANPDDPDPVTVDRHMIALLMDDPGIINAQGRWIKPADYVWGVGCIQEAAAKTELVANQFQSVVWLAWRRLQGIVDGFPGQMELDLPHPEPTEFSAPTQAA